MTQTPAGAPAELKHNLDLYRLKGFTGRRGELVRLNEWLTGGDDLPAIAISGEQGTGKSTLATAAAWSHAHIFTDGILRVSPAGTAPFRLYDVVRAMDLVLGTTITRASPERWGIAILEQLYRRRRLLILDKLAGATEAEIRTLVDIIGHLHESGGNSRLLLIDRNFQPGIAELVQFQQVHLGGLALEDVVPFVQRRAPQIAPAALPHTAELHALTGGAPLCMRLVLGLLRDAPWAEIALLLRDFASSEGVADVHRVAAVAIETLAIAQPHVGVLLDRLVTARGGASYAAVRDLFWTPTAGAPSLEETLAELEARGIVDQDTYRRRYVLHPVVRRYLEENAVLLGEEWERRHARYYLSTVVRYLELPLERWAEVDVEWGNLFKAADWCQQRVERIWQQRALTMASDPTLDEGMLTLPAEVQANEQSIKQDLRLVRAYALAMAHYAFWRHPPGSVAWLASGAVAAAALADPRDYGWFLMSIGRQFFFLGEIERAMMWFERARALFDPRDLLTELAYVLTDLGTSLRLLDQPRKALECFHAAFDCVAQSGDQQGLATAYMNLGSAYYSVNNFDRALLEHRKALRIGVRRNEHAVIGSALNNSGLALEAMDRLEDAQRAYAAALREFERLEDATGMSAAYNNLGSAAYARQEFAEAMDWYGKDLALLERLGSWTDMAAAFHNMGHVALETGDLDRAHAEFLRSRDLYAAFELNAYVAEEQAMLDYIDQQRAEPAEKGGLFRRRTQS
jgi:tetratricopeptide (TPR) repeat protein